MPSAEVHRAFNSVNDSSATACRKNRDLSFKACLSSYRAIRENSLTPASARHALVVLTVPRDMEAQGMGGTSDASKLRFLSVTGSAPNR
jgi:hypothetical protein